jgi:phosphoribosylformylglycinamidine synthase
LSEAAITVGVVVFPGSCDDADARLAVGRASGLRARPLWHGERDLGGADAVIVPGGFSYGDYLRAGAIARFSPVMEAVAEFARDGGPVLGICNGFQVLCEAGLLPGALLPNESLRFICRQLPLVVENVETPFTRGCELGDILSIPIKHASGRYFAPNVDELERAGQVVLRYANGSNPNGSLRDIAGVCNSERNVFGLMPHPEHAVDPLTGSADGLKLFESLAGLGVGAPVGAGA